MLHCFRKSPNRNTQQLTQFIKLNKYLVDLSAFYRGLRHWAFLLFWGGVFISLSACDASKSASKASSDASGSKDEIVVSNAFTQVTPPGQSVAAVYLRLENTSSKSHTLNYVYSSVSDRVEVHRHIYDEGIMRMREVKHLTIDPKNVLQFEPGGYHIMLFDLVKPFEAGETFELNFEFEGGQKVSTVAVVKPLG